MKRLHFIRLKLDRTQYSENWGKWSEKLLLIQMLNSEYSPWQLSSGGSEGGGGTQQFQQIKTLWKRMSYSQPKTYRFPLIEMTSLSSRPWKMTPPACQEDEPHVSIPAQRVILISGGHLNSLAGQNHHLQTCICTSSEPQEGLKTVLLNCNFTARVPYLHQKYFCIIYSGTSL